MGNRLRCEDLDYPIRGLVHTGLYSGRKVRIYVGNEWNEVDEPINEVAAHVLECSTCWERYAKHKADYDRKHVPEIQVQVSHTAALTYATDR